MRHGDIETELDIVGGTRFARYPQTSEATTVNMIVSDKTLVPYAGYEKALTLTASKPAREIYRSTRYDHLIVVVAREVFSVDLGLGFARIGQLESGAGNVFISENDASEIAIVDGTNKIYIFNYENDTFQKITLDFRPIYITFQDGYLIAAQADSSNWRLSGINNAVSWSPLDRQSIQTKADQIVAVQQFNRQLFVFGEKSTEIWHDLGLQLFPYVRDNSLSIDYGCLSATSIAMGFGMIVWLAANERASATLMVSTGGRPTSLSQNNDGLDFILDDLANPQDSFGFLFQEDGHMFYQINFITDKFSIVYDFNTKLFFTLSNECLEEAHIAKRIAFFRNTHYFISTIDASLYEMSSKISTYDEKIIPRVRITGTHRASNDSGFIVKRMTVQMEQGVDEAAGRVDVSISKDGGYSWSTIVGKELSPLGERRRQLKYWQLGGAKEFTPQFRFWSAGRIVVTNATITTLEALNE